jgi:nucleotide-binding universal stress UspA family protein
MGPEVFSRLPVDPSEESQWKVEEECQGQELLDKTVNRLRSAGWGANGLLRRGDAATEIMEYVKAADVSLIVAGSRGLSPVRAWLLGSVSRKLVHYAPCSVLIVKPPMGNNFVA